MSGRALPAAVAEAIARAGAVELAAELVRIPSHPGLPRQEEAVARALAAWLEGRGLRATLDEVRAGRPNLICTVESGRPGRELLLCGHTDTVPLNAGDPGAGFSGEVRDGRLWGRGALDMKGAVAAMAAALVALHETAALGAGRVTLAAVVDEEMQGFGAEWLVASGRLGHGAVVGEPTGNQVCLGHKGLEWLEIELVGRSAHGGTPRAGVNAIVAAARFVERVERELAPRWAARAHPLLGPPTLNFGTVAGGDQPSTVAARCLLAADRRSVPGERYATIVAELEALLDGVRAEMPGLRTEVRRHPDGVAETEHLAFATDADDPLAAAAAAAWRAERGEQARFGAFPAWTDGGFFAAAGVPTLVLGPGELALAHSPLESVPVAEIEEAARLYAATALGYCAAEPA